MTLFFCTVWFDLTHVFHGYAFVAGRGESGGKATGSQPLKERHIHRR